MNMAGLENIEILSFCVGLAVFTSHKFLVCCCKWKFPSFGVWQATPCSPIQRSLMESHRLMCALMPSGP
ncbi:mCG115034, isoform CRA_a [Mus musculus]|nr:mCG115034, isoform CRA_a [Mus musculus]EDL23883.1 mCG115034, isoform CRA_a [Mus musculus]EDL23884.1 mCG115034, isoform CRA_a [Mus musculus]EDL23885.1 mCG115034, isoform CRA_a [Mus musculus]